MTTEDRSKVRLVREYGREYSLFRTELLNRVVNHDLPRELAPLSIVGSFAVYRGSGLVYGYHGESDLKNIFGQSAKKYGQHPDLAQRRLLEARDIFAWLKPYYDNDKKISSLVELESFFERYGRYFFLQSVVQVIPRVELPEDLKRRSQELREEIQEYNESAETVFEVVLRLFFPTIGDDWRFLLPDEVWSGQLSGTKFRQRLELRKKGFVLHRDGMYEGPDTLEYLSGLGFVLDDGDITIGCQVVGQVAQKGISRGRVRIVDSLESSARVGEGDVLVTTMTMPRYLPAMKRACAFVTDEGGVTCHAAIIARELKVPCIIGTGTATRALREGDLVEVDAVNGKVTVLDPSSPRADN